MTLDVMLVMSASHEKNLATHGKHNKKKKARNKKNKKKQK